MESRQSNLEMQSKQSSNPDSSGETDSPDSPDSPVFSRSTTNRGFGLVTFQDDSGRNCSLQESSAVGGFIWLGVDDAEPKRFIPHVGYQDYPLPEGVVLSTRMHLTAEAALKLADELRAMAERVNENEIDWESDGDSDREIHDADHPLE